MPTRHKNVVHCTIGYLGPTQYVFNQFYLIHMEVLLEKSKISINKMLKNYTSNISTISLRRHWVEWSTPLPLPITRLPIIITANTNILCSYNDIVIFQLAAIDLRHIRHLLTLFVCVFNPMHSINTYLAVVGVFHFSIISSIFKIAISITVVFHNAFRCSTIMTG